MGTDDVRVSNAPSEQLPVQPKQDPPLCRQWDLWVGSVASLPPWIPCFHGLQKQCLQILHPGTHRSCFSEVKPCSPTWTDLSWEPCSCHGFFSSIQREGMMLWKINTGKASENTQLFTQSLNIQASAGAIHKCP